MLLVVAGIVTAAAYVLEDGNPDLRPGEAIPHAAQTRALLAGIPQRGIELGDPRAALALVEFGDLQSAQCARFAAAVLPYLLRSYVRPGKLRLLFRSIDLLGPDSLRAARMAAALSQQDRLFQFATLMYHNLGMPNTGYVTDTYLRALAGAIAGAHVARALGALNSPATDRQLRQTQELGARLNISGAPVFLLQRSGRRPILLRPAKLTVASFAAALRQAQDTAGP